MKTKGILYQEYEPTPDNPCEIKGLNLLYADEEELKIANERAYLLFEKYKSCEGYLSNPEHTIVSKHTLLKIEKDAIKKITDLLKEDNKEEKWK